MIKFKVICKKKFLGEILREDEIKPSTGCEEIFLMRHLCNNEYAKFK